MNFKKPKHGFTLIEMMIVITIVGVLMVSIKNAFTINNKDYYYSQSCINTVYGKVTNFLYGSLTSKSVKSGSSVTYPEYYKINFDKSQNLISFLYDDLVGSSGTRYSMYLTSSDMSKYYCNSNSYDVIITGINNLNLTLTKGFESAGDNTSVFDISGSNSQITGVVTFLLCAKPNYVCKELAQFVIDKRIQNIINRLCMSFNDDNTCRERSQ